MSTFEVKVPDIGDFDGVPVTEILVAVGDEVAVEDPLVALESEKATMEVPSPQAGTVKSIAVAVGDEVAEGALLLTLEGVESGDSGSGGGDAGSDGAKAEKDSEGSEGSDASKADAKTASKDDAEGDDAKASNGDGAQAADSAKGDDAAAKSDGDQAKGGAAPQRSVASDDVKSKGDVHADVVVLGSGPGGYSAAFRAADLGLSVVLVERDSVLGGVCLNVGCIPSKALLHAAKVITEAEAAAAHGIAFATPEIDLDALRGWKDEVVGKLSGGVAAMAKQRKVTVVTGNGRFVGPHELRVEGDETTLVTFDNAIVATGSTPVVLPGVPQDHEDVVDSTGALELRDVPGKLLVIGGGIIGLEMATVYDALGSEVTVVEFLDQLIPGADRDLVKPLQKRIEGRYAAIHLQTKVEQVEPTDDGLKATFGPGVSEPKGGVPEPAVFDRVLVAVGRTPNGRDLGLEDLGVEVDERGFVPVDAQQRTAVSHIFAIGDVVGQPMLAHKATHEAHVAAEVVAGHDVTFDVMGIPSVAYTDPEVAWVGLTETKAKADDVAYETAVFPWVASGRALASDAANGSTKLLIDPESRRVLGAGIVGLNAGELIAEPGLALELGANAEDVALTVHAHPTLSESIGLAAEIAEGTVTDLPQKRKR